MDQDPHDSRKPPAPEAVKPTDREDALFPVDPAAPEEKSMGFLDHLEELRWVLIKSSVFITIMMVVVFLFLGQLTDIMNAPLYRIIGQENLAGGSLVTVSPMGIFSLLIQIGFLGGVGLAMPFILYFFAGFIAPALTLREKRFLTPACLASVALFLFGVLLGYFVILPGFLFMANLFHQQIGIAIMWSADRYYSLVSWMLLLLGFSFQFPLVLIALIHLQIIETQKLVSYRRYMIVAFFVVGMIISPTWDPITQCLIALPMWLLYEATMKIGHHLEKRRRENPELYDEVD